MQLDLERLKEKELIVPVLEHRLNKPMVLVACGDGDRHPELYVRHQIMMRNGGAKYPRVHSICLNGGALLIPPESPLIKHGREDDKVILAHIAAGLEMKEMDTVALYAHLPCGMAERHKLSPAQVLDLLVQAKFRLKSLIPVAKVACFLHVAESRRRMRTYFVSATRWQRLVLGS